LSHVRVARVDHIGEWHVDLAFFLILGKLGSYPISPLWRFFRDLRAIHHIGLVSKHRRIASCNTGKGTIPVKNACLAPLTISASSEVLARSV